MPNTVILRGDPVRREDRATGVITPGHLIEFASNDRLQVHSTSGGGAARMFALECDYIGDPVTEAYAADDRIPYADCAPGDIVWAHLASGQNVARGDYLMSNGSGALTAQTGSNFRCAQADEDANASTGIAAAGTLRFRARVV